MPENKPEDYRKKMNVSVKKENVYSKKQLQRRVNFLKFLLKIRFKLAQGSKKPAGEELFLDTDAGNVRVLAYNLKKTEKLPLFVNIHGSGFVMGDAEMDDPYMMNIASKANVKILSIDYSLSPEAAFPQALNECYGVIKYAKEHAEEFKIDPYNIAVGGHSAGGNLSAAICLKDKEWNILGLKALILDYPPLDIYTDPYLKPKAKGALSPKMAHIFNASYCNNKEERKNPLISPAFATVDQLKSFPPTLIITASKDSLCRETEMFKDKLVDAGVNVTFKRFEAVHGFTHLGGLEADEAWQMMINHLNHHLKL